MKGSFWLQTAPPAPEHARLDGERHRRRRGGRRRHRRRDDRAAAARGRRARRPARGQPDRPRRDRPHHRQGLLPARPDLLAAAVQARRRRGARVRRGQRGRAGLDRRPRRARRHRLRLPRAPGVRLLVAALGHRGRDRGGGRGRAAGDAGRADAAAVPGRGRRALRRPGRVPRAQVPARARRPAARGLRAHARRPGRRRGPHAGRARDRRAHDRRHALPVPGPLAGLRARAPAALLRDRLPDRRRAAGGHVHQRRLPDPSRSAASRPATRSCCSSAAKVTGPAPAATPSGATARLEDFAREHWDVRSVDYRWSAQDNTSVDGLPLVGPDDAVRVARADGHRVREVGDDERHRRRPPAHRPRARPRQPVRVAVRPGPPEPARVGAASS